MHYRAKQTEREQTIETKPPNSSTHDAIARGPASAMWRAAFTVQLTKAVLADVTAYAKQCARRIERVTGTHDPNLGEELASDAIGDTWFGVVAWNPGEASLATHAKRVIRDRARNEAQRLALHPHVDIDHASLDLEREVSEAMMVERSGDAAEREACTADAVAALRALAAEDTLVLTLLDAYETGATECRDVMQVTGLSASEHHNAQRRLLRFARNLPADLHARVARAMS